MTFFNFSDKFVVKNVDKKTSKKTQKNQQTNISKKPQLQKSSPLLATYDVQLVEPFINEAIGNETTEITHVYLTVLTVDCGWVVLLVSAHMSPVSGLQTGHNEYPKR